MKLDLTINEINLILSALGKLPLEQVLDVFNKVRQQAEAQINEKPEGE
jgi:hypothetical protein